MEVWVIGGGKKHRMCQVIENIGDELVRLSYTVSFIIIVANIISALITTGYQASMDGQRWAGDGK